LIKESDLLEAIAECQGQRNPNANTCIKLAAYYTILDHITGNKATEIPEVPAYSFAAKTYQSDSEFWSVASGLDENTLMSVIDELMQTIKAVQPRLYDAVLRKLRS
jgi:hypothetical protein